MTLKGVVACVLFLLDQQCRAAFLTSFGNVTQGWPLHLTWDPIDPKYYPLSLSARLINRTAENHASGVLLNLTCTARRFSVPGFAPHVDQINHSANQQRLVVDVGRRPV